jgi:hypothetical protein
VADDIYLLACQCLIAILGRAEEVDRRVKGHKMKQMPPFERIQEFLGLERGQVGGLLAGLLRNEIHFLKQCDSALTPSIASYNKLAWAEHLLLVLMATLPLPGVTTTLIDNGFLALLQSIISSPNNNQEIAKSIGKQAGGLCLIIKTFDAVEARVDEEIIEGQVKALLELRLCVDSFLVQLLDMLVASKKRAMLIFYTQGGYMSVLQRLHYETFRPPEELSPLAIGDKDR